MARAPTGDTRAGTTVAVLAATAFFVAFGALHYGFYTRNLLQDTPLYEHYGDAMVHGGKLPYRDFAVEYPPGALPAFAAPSLVARAGDFPRYREVFELLMLACGGVASALVGVILARDGAGRVRLAGGTLLAGLAPLALGPVVLSRFDLWPAMLLLAGLAALVHGRRRLGAALLGCAVAAKLYPAVVVPLALLYVLRRYGRREALVCTGVAAAAALAWVAPFLVVAPHGVWTSLAGQASRPLQLESLGASFLLGAHQAWGLPVTVVPSHGSDNLTGSAAHLLAVLQGLAAPLAIVATWVAFARGEASRERLLRFAAAAVCAFIVLGKVLSPQYLVWLIGLVPLIRGRRGAVASALFLGAMVLTQLWFPGRYLELAYGLDAQASWFVLARDLALLGLLAILVMPVRRHPRAGVAVLAALVVGASAATVAGGAGLAVRSSLTHALVLDERGVASACARTRTPPSTSAGSVRYALTAFENADVKPRCVTVTVHARARSQLFAAAYVHAFDPAHITNGYLGDVGTCTNVAGATGATLRFSFRVPARSRYVVEVERCDATPSPPRYALTIRR